jgi:hypothetical protein
MTSAQAQVMTACRVCGVDVERCAGCERERCGAMICYRCLRLQLGQSLAHPHVHGG